jgi:hypothetical protein
MTDTAQNADIYPRSYDLTNPEERNRLLRELAGYVRVSAFYHEGTDREGREYAAMALLQALRLGYSLAPPSQTHGATP